MKLISLNCWGGKYFKDLIGFIKTHQNTDIFCFQEIFDTVSGIKIYKDLRANLLTEIKNILPDFNYLYFPSFLGYDNNLKKVNFNLSHGLAIFIKKTISVDYHQNYFIYKSKSSIPLRSDFSNQPIPLQVIEFTSSKKFFIFNFHGTPFPSLKTDTKKRINQSVYIRKILNYFSGAKILVGDFNLLPDTESIKLLEKNMRNLIKKYKIAKTRSRLSPFWGKDDFQKFADYAFVSKDVNVKSFQVPDVKVSDHLPMILEFS